LEHLTDEELAERAGLGDKGAFDRLVTQYWKRIYGYAFMMLRSREDAEDVAQETFLKAFRGRERFEKGRPFAPWLYRIATNTCVDEVRSRKKDIARSVDIEVAARGDDTPPEVYEREETRQLVREAILELPETYSQVVYLRYAAGMSYREIGAALAITEAAVEMRLFRGKRMMRSLLRRSLKWES